MREAVFYGMCGGRILEASVAVVRTSRARELGPDWSLKPIGPYTIALRLRAIGGPEPAAAPAPAAFASRPSPN